MTREQKTLRNLFLFEGATEAANAIAFPAAETFAAGEEIYTAANYRKALGVMLEGKAVAEPAGDGKALLTVFTAGAVFGAAALFGAEEPYVSRIRATGECKVLFLSEQWLQELFEAYPQTAVNYIRFLSSRIRFLNGKIALFTKQSAESKVYDYLAQRCDATGFLPQKLNLSRLSEELCMGRTSVYRALETLEQKQLILRTERKVQVIL